MEKEKRPTIHRRSVSPLLLILNVIVSLIYFSWWLSVEHIGNPVLYGLLFFGEVYHLFMAISFWLTIIPVRDSMKDGEILLSQAPLPGGQTVDGSADDDRFSPTVDIFITVAGEPTPLVRGTVLATKALDYQRYKVFILNDGFVGGKENWREIEELAKELGVVCITRTVPGGAKAGNINHALKMTEGELVAILDTDMVPHRDFLRKTVDYFREERVGFVQTPQYYKNRNFNEVTGAAWDQQELFFGPILSGKERYNSVFICGTNLLIRRRALRGIGGMYEKSIAEDFVTSLLIHQEGWVSRYVPEVLCEGLAPEDLLSYCKQQFRWARGSLQILISENPLFKKNLSWTQKIQYLASALYYLNGLIVLIDFTIPLLFLFFGVQTVISTTTSFALFFIPFMLLNLLTLYIASDYSITFRALALAHAGCFLQLSAIRSVIFLERTEFSVTPKRAQTGNFLPLAIPHIVYIVLVIAAIFVGVLRDGFSPSVVTNSAWAFFNCILFLPFILASYNWSGIWGRLIRTQKGVTGVATVQDPERLGV